MRRAHLQILGDQAHVMPKITPAMRIGFFTPLYQPNPVHNDLAMSQLTALDTLYEGFELNTPRQWDQIDLAQYRHLFFDEVFFNPDGTAYQPLDTFGGQHIEFNTNGLMYFYKKARKTRLMITLITQTLPLVWRNTFKRLAGIQFKHCLLSHPDKSAEAA